MADKGKIRTVAVEATYESEGCGGLVVSVSKHVVRLSSGTGGTVPIGIDKWGAVKRLVDESIEHYRVLTAWD